ncbi:MAG: DUF3971 domain-containing protein, partial [Shimia sp.]
PGAGGPRIRVLADDGGGVIRDAGLFANITGGQLSLILTPNGRPGGFDGQAELDNIRVRDAPAMAQLFSAVSVVGLLEQLDGQGLQFTEVDASFRLTPGLLEVLEASAVGPSMGISLDGRMATGSGQMQFRGVLSPLYLLNGIGSIFTRRGEGLIGFTYTLAGTPQAPQIGVNPFSALTPAMFREIFRKPVPEPIQ